MVVAKRAHSRAAAVAGAVVALPPEDQAVAEEVGSRVVAVAVAAAAAGAAAVIAFRSGSIAGGVTGGTTGGTTGGRPFNSDDSSSAVILVGLFPALGILYVR